MSPPPGSRSVSGFLRSWGLAGSGQAALSPSAFMKIAPQTLHLQLITSIIPRPGGDDQQLLSA